MYTLLKKERHGGAALNIAQRLRSHKSEESTNMYIKIPDEDINKLSINLFNRGIFGYIPKILSEIVYGNTTSDLTEETNNRSEEHTSELQSRGHLVCRLLL